MPITENREFKHPFNQRCYQTIIDYTMLQNGDAVLVGVSGGPDSMALLHTLMVLSDIMNLRLGVAHLNHGLRQTAADHDEQFVKTVANNLGLPVFAEKKDIQKEREKTGLTIEEAGREARYQFFNNLCRKKGFTKIAVGHHRDDNAEQVLLNLLRGSGPAGMAGIPPVRKNIIRPLIRVSRTEIMDYVNSRKIVYVKDLSNNDEQFARNKIRHHLIPMLKTTYNPKISESLVRLGSILQSEEEWIGGLIEPLLDQAVLSSSDRQMALSVSTLQTFHPAAQRRIFRSAILKIKGNLRRITYLHMDAILRLLNTDITNARIDLPDQLRIARQEDRLIVKKEKENLRIATFEKIPVIPEFEYLVSRSTVETQGLVFIYEINTRIRFHKTDAARISTFGGKEETVAYFDWDSLHFPLIIRNFRPGDKFSPMGMKGSQKVKKFFINNKIDPVQRAATPLVVSGNRIIWVGGYRIAETVKITSKTKTVLTAEISPNNARK